jgi:hypothetical protein
LFMWWIIAGPALLVDVPRDSNITGMHSIIACDNLCFLILVWMNNLIKDL